MAVPPRPVLGGLFSSCELEGRGVGSFAAVGLHGVRASLNACPTPCRRPRMLGPATTPHGITRDNSPFGTGMKRRRHLITRDNVWRPYPTYLSEQTPKYPFQMLLQ